MGGRGSIAPQDTVPGRPRAQVRVLRRGGLLKACHRTGAVQHAAQLGMDRGDEGAWPLPEDGVAQGYDRSVRRLCVLSPELVDILLALEAAVPSCGQGGGPGDRKTNLLGALEAMSAA